MQRIEQVAIGIIRHNNQVVMVQQAEPTGTFWVLPGGLVEPGELVAEGLIREVREESGLEVTEIAWLACISQIDRPQYAMQAVFYIFEIAGWTGTLGSADPDNEVIAVAWVSVEQAVAHTLNAPWPGVAEPIIAYLSGQAQAGELWMYRQPLDHGAADQQLIQRIGRR